MKRKLKKAVAVILTAAMAMSVGVPAFAATNGESLTQIELEKQYLELSKQQTSVTSPYLMQERITAQELYKILLENNKTGANRVYSAEDVIMDINSGVAMASNTPATADVISVNGSYWKYFSSGDECWFTFQTVESPNYLGAYDIYTSGSLDTTAYLYKENTNGTMTLVASNNNGNDVNAYITADLEGSTVYYVKLTATTAGSTTLYTLRHADARTVTHSVTLWQPLTSSPLPDTGKIIPGIYYLDEDATKDLYLSLDKPSVIEFLAESVADNTVGNAWIAYMVSEGVPAKIARFIVFMHIDWGAELLTEVVKENIYNESNNFKNGVKVVVTSDMLLGTNYDITSWTNNTVQGAPGYRGAFVNDPT